MGDLLCTMTSFFPSSLTLRRHICNSHTQFRTSRLRLLYTHTELPTSPEDNRQQTGGRDHVIFASGLTPEQNEANRHLKYPLYSVRGSQKHCKDKTVRPTRCPFLTIKKKHYSCFICFWSQMDGFLFPYFYSQSNSEELIKIL